MTDSERASGSRRRVLMIGLTAVFVAALAGFLLYQHFYGSLHETTEDAYVGGNLVQLTPQISGTALAIYADDTDLVHAGQTIVKLDESDRRIALERAEAELAQAVREVGVLFASGDQLSAEVAVREAELARAVADVQRRDGLSARGLVPREELDHAREHPPPRSGRHEWQEAFEHQHQREGQTDGRPHQRVGAVGRLPPGPFMNLKNSLLRSTTRRSLRLSNAAR